MGDTKNMSEQRAVGVQYDNRGDPFWVSCTSPPDNSVGVCQMVSDRVIPIIFVPGVMGSNLIGTGQDNQGKKWLVDSNESMVSWLGRGPEARKKILNPKTMNVYQGGKLPQGTALPDEELKRRYWGEVGAMSYSEFLVWLENALSDNSNWQNGERIALINRELKAMVGEARPDKDQIALTYRYRFPVYDCGYNWLDSNANSAKRLGNRIDEVIARYRKEKKKVEKVIVVTHSMGGLVARHCSEVLGYSKKILGVVHGVMPAIGAAAVYRRFKAGTEGAYVASEVLGNDAAEMTAVLSSAPGPLQLLPTPEYGNGWLKIKDGAKEYALPDNGNPYGQIYAVRGKWWSMCEDHLMNPLNKEMDANKKRAKMDVDWTEFENIIDKQIKPFHRDIEGKYHLNTHAFFGSHSDHLSYGNVTWTGDGGGWLRGKREADVLGAKPLDPSEIDDTRTVSATLKGEGWLKAEHQTYAISKQDENGDGTVPHRSGLAPKKYCKSFLQVNVEHEPAYKASKGEDNLRACHFALRAIVQIAQDVQQTSLRYE